MTDSRTMAEMLRAPTEGCAEAFVVPSILAKQFELKHCLINMMTSEQFFGLGKDNPHDYVRNSQSKPIASPVNAYDNHSISELAKITHAVNQQTSAVTTAMTAMLKQFQSNPPPAQVKVVEEIYVTCGGAYPYYQCLAAGGNTFLEYRDNIQGYVSAATGNFNQGNPGYRPQGVANQMRSPEKIKRMNDVCLKAMQTQIDMVKNELRNEMKTSIQTSLSNQTNEIKNMMASLLQMNTASTSGSRTLPGNTIANSKGKLKAITTRSGLVTERPTVPNPLKSVNPEEDECVEETYTDPDHAEFTTKVPPPLLVQKPKPSIQRNFVLHTRDSLPPHIPYPFRMLKQKHELKCKALADLGASINLMPLTVWKKLGLPNLIPTRMTLELANRAICTPDGITRDVFVPVGKFTFLADFVVVDYESDPRVPLILGRPFLRIARALIDVHGEEMILCDGDERFDVYPDDFLEIKSGATFDNNSFDFEGEKIKEDDVLPSPDNEDKVFNPGILSHEKSVKIITRVAQEKKLVVSFASLLSEDFDPPFYELLVFKKVPNSMRLLPFSSKMRRKFLNQGFTFLRSFIAVFSLNYLI
nr:reverse transcriptase domain-containing protein [Tanacetum cinerariifolium]